jgi:hypothetical protein
MFILSRQISSTRTKLLCSLKSPLIDEHLWVFGDFLISMRSIKSFLQRVWQSILRIFLKNRELLFFFSTRGSFQSQSWRIIMHNIPPPSLKSITRTRRRSMANILIVKPSWAARFFKIQTIGRSRRSFKIRVMSKNSRRMVKWTRMVPILIISSFSSILHTILFSHSSQNVSSDDMSIKPEPPTGKIMLLSASVIRQKGPDLRRGISVRIPTKTLKNSLRVISLRLLFVGGRVCQDSLFTQVLHRPLFAFPTSFLPPAPQVLVPTGSNEQRVSFLRSHARFQAGVASLLLSSHVQQQKSSKQT